MPSEIELPPMPSIWRRKLALDKAQRTEIGEATKDIRARYREEFKKLQAECGATGHTWRFTDVGIFSHIHWYDCGNCGATKSENLELAAAAIRKG